MADWYKASLAVQHQVEEGDNLPFVSRRSPVLCRHACVASSQPLASSIGYDLLKAGANAAEAAIGVAAALAVTEPCSTGLGGDMFCLYYDAESRKVTCVNGSGKSPHALSLAMVQERCANDEAFMNSPLACTVPGAAQGWYDVLQRYGSGKFTLTDLLEPAARLAEDGFPVSPVTSHHWKEGMFQITRWLRDGERVPLTMDGINSPQAGEVFVNPDVARVLRALGTKGPTEGFYGGEAGRAILERVQELGGCMILEDLLAHESTYPDPISVEYRGCRLWQVPPNGQGVAGLIALAGLRHLEEKGIIDPISKESIGGTDTYHAMMEMMRLGFADARAYVSDPDHQTVSNDWLVDTERIGKRAEVMFDPTKATIAGSPDASSCTVSFQVVDAAGNAISFVNSNYTGFGSGIVPRGCGFTLQNRGAGFTLTEGHPNAVGPAKRPYHTIIPGMLTHSDTGELYATISNMGGNMQPQGHMQLTVGLLAGELDPQTAIDTPRFCIVAGTQQGAAFLESGVNEDVVHELKKRGHDMKTGVKGHDRSVFGRAQIIKRDRTTGVLWAGSDGRADGCAMGF